MKLRAIRTVLKNCNDLPGKKIFDGISKIVKQYPDKIFVISDLMNLLPKYIGYSPSYSALRRWIRKYKDCGLYQVYVVYPGGPMLISRKKFDFNKNFKKYISQGLGDKIAKIELVRLFLNLPQNNDSVFSRNELRDIMKTWFSSANYKSPPVGPSLKSLSRIVVGRCGVEKSYFGNSIALQRFAKICHKLGKTCKFVEEK